jgi:NADH:ubiquinone oxidoreductase subunit 6 (subunit J)
MNSFNLLLEFLTLISLISALCVITSTNPVIAIVFLIVLFVNVGIYLILMGLQFIGLSYLLVYVGAITVLFLFIVMMLSTEVVSSVEVGPNYSKLLPLVYSVAILFLILFLITIPSFFVDFTSGNLGREIYSIINSIIFNSSGTEENNIGGFINNNFISAFIQLTLNWFDYFLISIFGNINSSLHPLAWVPENMSNDPFSLFLADSLNELDPKNTKYLSTIANNPQITNLKQTVDSINSSILSLQVAPAGIKSTSFIEQYNLSPFFNQLFFVELNPTTTFGAEGQIKNPDGFYYYHPLVHSSVNQGITTFNSGAESLPFLFPVGWYSDDPYSLFLQWISNKNISVFLWHTTRPAYFPYLNMNYPGYENLHWVNILFANTATNINYAGAAYSKWFSSSSVDLMDMGINLHSYRKYFLPAGSLHNYLLNISWLGIPFFPEFLVEFPQSPVFSPIYFSQNVGIYENDFGTVYHFIEKYNGHNENISFINESAFGEPSTLLYKNLQINTLGEAIYGYYSILLIFSGFLLLLAMVCPIVLARSASPNPFSK